MNDISHEIPQDTLSAAETKQQPNPQNASDISVSDLSNTPESQVLTSGDQAQDADPAEMSQLNQLQDEINEKLDILADQIENIVELYVAARKSESVEDLNDSDSQIKTEPNHVISDAA